MLLLAAALAAAAVPDVSLAEARHALTVGRLDQARTMIAAAVGAGATGAPVDRLLADLAFAQGDSERSAALYSALLMQQPGDVVMTERAGLSRLRLGRLREAEALLRRASGRPGASWMTWNGLGAIADGRGDWVMADDAYERAAQLAPNRAEVANNRGWSLLLRGQWSEAEAELTRGVALDPAIGRLANNLDLARAALAAALPARRSGETDEGWSARLNDAGVAAAVRGERTRAIAAFSRAIDARAQWNRRASANLAAVEHSAGSEQR